MEGDEGDIMPRCLDVLCRTAEEVIKVVYVEVIT